MPVYLRFVSARRVEGMQAREGFFQLAGVLAEDPLTEAATVARLDELRQWFADNLELPERFSRGRGKGGSDDTRGLSWFKPSAKEHVARAFELKRILDEHGTPIDVLKESRIGYLVYEDEHQVVAEPFADTRQ